MGRCLLPRMEQVTCQGFIIISRPRGLSSRESFTPIDSNVEQLTFCGLLQT